MIRLICDLDQDIFQALDKAKKNGESPPDAQATIDRAQSPQGFYPKPDNAIGTVQAGYKSSFWIIKE